MAGVNTMSIEAFDCKKVKKASPLEIIKRIGPGLILTGIVIGPGNITTSAMLGANFGYEMLWIILPIAFMGTTFMLVSYRLSMMTGLPILHAIRKYYGGAASAFCGIALFLTCFFFTMGNITGTGAGMTLVFGLPWKIGSAIMLAALAAVYLSKNVYGKVEKGVMVCIAIMIVSFYITLVGVGGADGAEVVKGLTNWHFPEGALVTSLAYISTNASVTSGIYGTYLGKEKKWKKEDLFNGIMLWDAIAHITTVILISGAIVLVGAIVLHPTGEAIKAPAQLAALLVPIMGKAANYIMGFALLGAGFSSLLGNTQRGMVLFAAGVDKETGLESKLIKYGCLACIVVAAVICYSYGGSPTQLIYIANVLTAIATPIAGFFMCLLICRKDVNKEFGNPRILQICMIVSYVFCLVMTVSSLKTTIPKLLASLGM